MALSRAAFRLISSTLLAASTLAFLNNNPLPAFRYNGHIATSLSALYEDTGSVSDSTPPVTPQTPNIATRRLLRERFTVGDYYVWLYQDKDGTPTSWEKYTVTESNIGVVVIEMATKFSEYDKYSTHHRMTVDLAHHLESHDNRTAWRIGFEYRAPDVIDDEAWKTFGNGENVQAFEEKFDVFSMLNATDTSSSAKTSYRTVRVGTHESNATLVRTARHEYTGAWYFFAPPENSLSGVAVLKDVAEHSFSLIKSGTGTKETNVRIQP